MKAWRELRTWVLRELRAARRRCAEAPDHVGFRGEVVALRAVLRKVNQMKKEMKGDTP
jgi:hypothetical protein